MQDRISARRAVRVRAVFGPLEVRYASREGADPAELRRRIENGPYSIWRYADFLPVEHPHSALAPAGRRWCAPTGSPRSWGSVSCGSRTTPPTRRIPSRIGSCRSRSRERRSWASRPSPAPRPATSPTRSPLTPPPRGSIVRVHPLGPRGGEGARHRHLRDQHGGGERQLRRRQPPLHRARGRARLGVREHQHEAVLRRGVEDTRLRDR